LWKRAKRNFVKERIYKYIRTKIWQLHPGFNIGITTPITKKSDLWERPYLHWNFIPRNYTKNEELTKQRAKSQVHMGFSESRRKKAEEPTGETS